MPRLPFADGWSVGPKLGAFESRDESTASVPVQLPHDALRDLPRSADSVQGVHSGYIPGGVFEYSKTFDVPADWCDRTVRIEFEGVYRDATVFINGDFAAHEANGYSAFVVDADPYLRFGASNTITVEARVHRDSRWYTGGGISRPVHLVVDDPVHIVLDGTVATSSDIDEERAVVDLATRVENRTRHTATRRLSWTLIDPHGAEVASGTAPITVLPGTVTTGRARLLVPSPLLWGPDSPHLHVVRTTLSDAETVIQEETTRFGIRRLQLDPVQGLRINGTPVDLRGACIHHDNGPLGAVSIAAAEDRRVALLKTAGFNAIRSAHNPASRALLDACDRHGMLVMDELTDVWTKSKTAFDSSIGFDTRWQQDVAALVAKDLHHPSVILYSIGNEILELATPHGATWSRRIAEEFRRLDPTRFVTNGINGIIANLGAIAAAQDAAAADPNTMMAGMGEQMARMNASELVTATTEESAAVLDVVGFNYADSRYDLDAELFPNRIIVGSETFPDRIASLWADVRRLPHVIGDFTWTGWDYIGEAGIGRVDYTDVEGYTPSGTAGPFPYLLGACGDIDITGHRLPVSYYREIAYGLRAEPVIAVHRPQHHGRPTSKTPWSWDDVVSSWTWDAAAGSPVTVDVYADADEVELLLDGAVIDRVAVGSPLPLIARFETEYRRGALTAVAYSAGVEVGRSALRTAGAPQLIARAEQAGITGPEGLAYVAITLEDADGIVVCDADTLVTVAVSGGEIAGMGSGQPRTEEGFAGPSRHTYDGRVLVIIRPSGEDEIVVTASAEGYPPAEVVIGVESSGGDRATAG
ncbi:Beta-galactosidase BoGH2A [Microbacterium oxydans]|uniref:glycoside hydrolase family 2 TIM barrel-domain containing protein n=1 Tax=Microbacterium oxydans TaxID=82380 RepID=UPI001DEBA3DF|nr:glycoside hydrolase family 2 TIM barrel-domain containing protein [Microbacterium oxydans]CAH0220417.1 Beta-galactosidase BoGH2A [Microbacterium oxydans]